MQVIFGYGAAMLIVLEAPPLLKSASFRAEAAEALFIPFVDTLQRVRYAFEFTQAYLLF